MQTVNDLLDRVKEAKAIPSDYKLALYLGVVPGAVKHWRHDRSLPDTRTINRLASELGMDADLMVLQIEAQRAPNDDARAVWSRIAHRLQAGAVHVAVLVAMAVVALLGSAPNAEAAVTSYDASSPQSVYYVKSALRRLISALRRAVRSTVACFAQGINDVQSADTDAAYSHAA